MPRGPVYDNVLRRLAADDLATLLRWLGQEVHRPVERLSESLPASGRFVDLLARTAPGRLVHVEFVTAVEPDLPYRMLEYRARIMRLHLGEVITQVVLVIGTGTMPEVLTNGDDLTARCHPVHVRDVDPAELLATPALAPLAPLARATDRGHRERLLREALRVIRERTPPDRATELADAATTLAAIHLDAPTIDAVGKEVAMPFILEETIGGRSLAERVRREALAEGRQEGGAEVLTRLLEARFGDDPRWPGLAHTLLARHGDDAVEAVLAASGVEDLTA